MLGNARPVDGMPEPLRMQTLRSALVGVYSTGERLRGVRLASNAWMCGPEEQLWRSRLGEGNRIKCSAPTRAPRLNFAGASNWRSAARASRIPTCEQSSRKPASLPFAHGLVPEQHVESFAAIEWRAFGNARGDSVFTTAGIRSPTDCCCGPSLSAPDNLSSGPKTQSRGNDRSARGPRLHRFGWGGMRLPAERA